MNPYRWPAVLLAIVVILSMLPGGVKAEPFTVLKSTVWMGLVSMPEGFYVAPNAVLTIMPGTVVKLGGNVGVKGRIVALGNRSEPITFTSIKESPQPGDWGHFEFQTTDGSCNFSHCTFLYGGKGGFGTLKIGSQSGMDDRIRFENCTVSSSASQGFWMAKAEPVITNCTVKDCLDPAKGAGIWLQEGSSPSISGTVIENCQMAMKIDLDSNPSMLGNLARKCRKNAIVVDTGTVTKKIIWDSNIPYLLEKNIVLAKGGNLTVMPGNVIKLATSISVADGSLNLLGTALEPVTVTSVNDDTVGGDVYGDASGKAPQAGDWGQIEFQANALPCTFSFANISWGGGKVDENSGYGIIKFGAAGGVDSRIKLFNCNITHSQTTGLWFQASNPAIYNTTVSDCRNEEFGAAVWLMSRSKPVLSGCKLSDCKWAIYSDGDSYAMATGLVVEDNQFNCIYYGERYESLLLDGDVVWNSNLVHYIPKTIGVQPTGVLRLMPGVIIKYSGIIRVDGRLIAVGTKEKPIVFTSLKDDTFGGDTNGDKGFEEPKPGDNQGIQFVTSRGKSVLHNCIIRYGGEGGNGNVYFGQDKNVKNEQVMDGCIIEHSLNQAIKARKANADIIDCDIRHCASKNTGYAIQMENECSVRMVDCRIEKTQHLFDMTPECRFQTKNIVSKEIGEELIGGYGGIHINKTLGKRLSKDTIWNAEYPFILEDDLTIDKGVTLTIEKGNVVKLPRSFYVYGSLNCAGTAEDPIYFTSVHDDTVGGDSNLNHKQSYGKPGDFGLIEFNGSMGESTLNHVVLRFGGGDLNLGSMRIGGNTGVDDRLRLSNVTIENSSTYGYYIQNSKPFMRDLVVRGCMGKDHFGSAFYAIGKSEPDILGVNMSECTWAVYNNMVSGGEIAIRKGWFGDASGPKDDNGNPDGKGLLVKGEVSYKPFETAPITTAGAGGKGGELPPYRRLQPAFDSPVAAPEALTVTPEKVTANLGSTFEIAAKSGKAPYRFKSLDESVCKFESSTESSGKFKIVSQGATIVEITDASDQTVQVWVSNPQVLPPENPVLILPKTIIVRVGQTASFKVTSTEAKAMIVPGKAVNMAGSEAGEFTVYASRNGVETLKASADGKELSAKIIAVADEGPDTTNIWDFRVVPGDGKAKLIWRLPNVMLRPFENVVLTMNGNLVTEISPDQTSYSVNGLKNGIAYTFVIKPAAGGTELKKACTPNKLQNTIVLWIGKPDAVVDGKNMTIDRNKAVVPTIVGKSTMVPFRFIGEALGAEVGWAQETKEVGFWTPKADIRIYIGKKQGTNFGNPITVDPMPQTLFGKTYIPLRAVSELLGAKVVYDAKQKKITITYERPWSPTW